MSNGTEYKIGQFDQAIEDIRERLARVEQKVDNLNAWRLKTIGAVSAVSIAANILINSLI